MSRFCLIHHVYVSLISCLSLFILFMSHLSPANLHLNLIFVTFISHLSHVLFVSLLYLTHLKLVFLYLCQLSLVSLHLSGLCLIHLWFNAIYLVNVSFLLSPLISCLFSFISFITIMLFIFIHPIYVSTISCLTPLILFSFIYLVYVSLMCHLYFCFYLV